MYERTPPDAGMLILTELGHWTGEERSQYVSALRELSVRAAVRVSVVSPADPLADPAADAPAATRPFASRPAYVAAVGQAERAVRELWQPDRASDRALRAALGHAAAELSRMRELLLTTSCG